jgi:very-short-patch-repair endonuclease
MGAELDRRLARVAAAQHGAITRKQLVEAGLRRGAIGTRVRNGRLHRVHRGVYAVGHHGLSQYGLWMAAVLAHGEGAVLSHTSAAVLWGFLKPRHGPIHVTSPSPNGRSRRNGIVFHRSPSLTAGSVPLTTLRSSIPATTPRRTIEDLPSLLPDYLVRRAKRQAEFLGYKLRLPTDRSRSDLEAYFLAFCRRHRLPLPEVNVKVGSWTVDFLWPERMVAVETDLFDYHRGSQAFEDDHEREFDLRREGYTVRRYTGAQLDDYPAEIVAELGDILGSAKS